MSAPEAQPGQAPRMPRVWLVGDLHAARAVLERFRARGTSKAGGSGKSGSPRGRAISTDGALIVPTTDGTIGHEQALGVLRAGLAGHPVVAIAGRQIAAGREITLTPLEQRVRVTVPEAPPTRQAVAAMLALGWQPPGPLPDMIKPRGPWPGRPDAPRLACPHPEGSREARAWHYLARRGEIPTPAAVASRLDGLDREAAKLVAGHERAGEVVARGGEVAAWVAGYLAERDTGPTLHELADRWDVPQYVRVHLAERLTAEGWITTGAERGSMRPGRRLTDPAWRPGAPPARIPRAPRKPGRRSPDGRWPVVRPEGAADDRRTTQGRQDGRGHRPGPESADRGRQAAEGRHGGRAGQPRPDRADTAASGTVRTGAGR